MNFGRDLRLQYKKRVWLSENLGTSTTKLNALLDLTTTKDIYRKFGDPNYKSEYTFKSNYNKSYFQKILGPLKYKTECNFKYHYK